MHAYIALVVIVAAPALAAPGDRIGYDREIDSARYKQIPKHHDYVLNEEYLASQKNRAKLITRIRPDEPVVADNVILESNVVKIVRPSKREVERDIGTALVRLRRGYNLENVRVPARYPYLAVPKYYRNRHWG
ncbi:uncharacterized protein LOC114249561 [Bombyx mandarina]|uniref:Uncharacterized protein LOC114249561 n=1 Tax=Bombyx mandarina TaxID=7092 RepID=A0A6J2KFH8_BOMMA|nr:uncharacterized protein LOC114249561 [Bombyx mandarina]